MARDNKGRYEPTDWSKPQKKGTLKGYGQMNNTQKTVDDDYLKGYVPQAGISRTTQATDDLGELRSQSMRLSNEMERLQNALDEVTSQFARMKREYEDILYNLDDDNMSSVLLKEKAGMKSEIKQTAEAIISKVSKTANYKAAARGAGAPTSESDKSRLYYNTENKMYYYYNELIKEWETVDEQNIYSVFEQTADGFNLKGNVVIDGNAVVTKNLKLTGNVTWDMSNSPVKAQYSIDGSTGWHEGYAAGDMYMRMSFDGGANWNNVTKIVGINGQDGANGHNGSDATVNDVNVFNALTNGGKFQGIFTDGAGKLYLNAQYINGETLTGVSIRTNKNAFNDWIELNSQNQRLDVYYSNVRVGTIYPSNGNVIFSGINGANLRLGGGSSESPNVLSGYWEIENAVVTNLSDGNYQYLTQMGGVISARETEQLLQAVKSASWVDPLDSTHRTSLFQSYVSQTAGSPEVWLTNSYELELSGSGDTWSRLFTVRGRDEANGGALKSISFQLYQSGTTKRLYVRYDNNTLGYVNLI